MAILMRRSGREASARSLHSRPMYLKNSSPRVASVMSGALRGTSALLTSSHISRSRTSSAVIVVRPALLFSTFLSLLCSSPSAIRFSYIAPLVITALTRASGPLGLSAFLPPSERTLGSFAGKLPSLPFPFLDAAPSDTNQDIPHLPLADKWQDGRFALRDVMGAAGERNVRKWTLALLQRYRYVIGAFRYLVSPLSLFLCFAYPSRSVLPPGLLLSSTYELTPLSHCQRTPPPSLSASSPHARLPPSSPRSTELLTPRCSASTTTSSAVTPRLPPHSARGRSGGGAFPLHGSGHERAPTLLLVALSISFVSAQRFKAHVRYIIDSTLHIVL